MLSGCYTAAVVCAQLGVVKPVLKRCILDSQELYHPAHAETLNYANIWVRNFSWLRLEGRHGGGIAEQENEMV
jgi:hypothetical protein